MPEDVITPAADTKKFGTSVSKGAVTGFNPNIQKLAQNQGGGEGGGEESGAADTPEAISAKNIAAGKNADGTEKTAAPITELSAEKKAENIAAGLNEDGSPKTSAVSATELPKLTKEQIKALYDENFPTTIQPTEAEIKDKTDKFEKRMLDLFVEEGLKNPEKKAEDLINQYAALKAIASGDLTELSKAELTRELKAAGFDEGQIADIQKERYYQLEQAEIDAIEDPAEKALAQKKLDYGKKKLEGKATHQKQAAEQFFNTLKSAVTEKDLQATKESEFSSNVEEHFKNVERKLALQLGKSGDDEIAPVEYEVPETVIEEAKNVLKDKELRKQFLYNSDGSLNLANLSETILKAKMFDSAAKTAYLTGGHRQVEAFEKIFPKNANALGVGGNNSAPPKGTGKLVSAGQPQRHRPAVNQ